MQDGRIDYGEFVAMMKKGAIDIIGNGRLTIGRPTTATSDDPSPTISSSSRWCINAKQTNNANMVPNYFNSQLRLTDRSHGMLASSIYSILSRFIILFIPCIQLIISWDRIKLRAYTSRDRSIYACIWFCCGYMHANGSNLYMWVPDPRECI